MVWNLGRILDLKFYVTQTLDDQFQTFKSNPPIQTHHNTIQVLRNGVLKFDECGTSQ